MWTTGYLPGVIRCADIDLDSGRLGVDNAARALGRGGGRKREADASPLDALARPHNCVRNLEPLKLSVWLRSC